MNRVFENLSDIQIQDAVNDLRSLRDGASGTRAVLHFGRAAVPALSKLLFERERSGLFDARCHAAQALAALGAFDVLGEFLSRPHIASDAVESLGEDVVISFTALAIAERKEEWVYSLLYDLALIKPLRGVLAGLGMFLKEASIPIFISALEEDEVRATAETVLRNFGTKAQSPLLAACHLDLEKPDESESHRRKRRASLALLIEIGIPENARPILRDLTCDYDAQIAELATEAWLNLNKCSRPLRENHP